MKHLDVGLVGETLFEELGEPTVFFDQRGGAAMVDRELGERAQAGANFHEVILGAEIELVDDPGGGGLVMEKILPEALGGAGLEGRQGLLDGGAVHGMPDKLVGLGARSKFGRPGA